jgi:hypothetical protein
LLVSSSSGGLRVMLGGYRCGASTTPGPAICRSQISRQVHYATLRQRDADAVNTDQPPRWTHPVSHAQLLPLQLLPRKGWGLRGCALQAGPCQ